MNRKSTKGRITRQTGKTEKGVSKDLCQEHTKKLDHLCMNHNSLLCELCSNLYHSECKTAQIASLKQTLKYDLHELRRNASLLVSHYETADKMFQTSQDDTLAEIEDAELEIKKMFEYLKSQIKGLGARNNEQIVKRRIAAKEFQQDVQDALYTLRNVGNNTGELEQLEKTNKSLEIKLARQKENKYTLHMTVAFDDKFKNFLGKVKEPFAIGTVKVRENAGPDLNNLKLNFGRYLDLTKTEKLNFVPQYTSLEFLSDGRLITLDSYNKRCTIIGEQLDTLGKYSLNTLPWI